MRALLFVIFAALVGAQTSWPPQIQSTDLPASPMLGPVNACVSASSSATAYTCPTTIATTCAANIEVLWTPDIASGATPTLDVGCGAKAINTNENASPATGQFGASVPVRLRYDGTSWRAPAVIPSSTGGSATGNLSVSSTVLNYTFGVIVPVVRASAAAGLYSGTYTSGITATGSAGQTCTLTALNGGGALASATVALTGSNAIAGGTALVVTATGSAYTTAPTSATAGNGTATCSGTAVVGTALSVPIAATGFYINDNAAPLTYVLPAVTAANVGLQVCMWNGNTRTSVQTIKAPASTYIDNNGANGSAAGTLVFGGALADAACFVATSVTQYKAFVQSGSVTNN